jgi:ribosome-associated toxin RatA of RatAB toxin-antitoxin module
MKNKMSRFLVLAFLVLGTASLSFAQMKPAKMSPPSTKREVTIKAPANEVWKLIASLEKVEEYVPTLVKSSLADGNGLDAVREMVMADGTPRLEEVQIYDPANKTIAFKPFDEYLPTIYLSVYYRIIAQGPNKCKVSMSGYFKAKEGASESKIIKQLGSEFSKTLKGLKSYLEK